MSVKKALATLPLVLNACGGSDGDSTPDYTPNAPGQGIWKGGFSAEPISTSGASGAVPSDELAKIDADGVGVYTSSGRAFFYNELDDVLFTNDAPGVINSGSTYNLVYSPDIYTAGSRTGSVNFDGNAYISTSITGEYSQSITGHYAMIFDQKYFQAANFSHFVGTWLYTSPVGVWTLEFASSDGLFTIITDGTSSCAGNGGMFKIGDGSKNEYDVSISLSNCGNSNFNGNYYGAAALIDGSNTNDTILMGFSTNSSGGDHGFFLKPVKN